MSEEELAEGRETDLKLKQWHVVIVCWVLRKSWKKNPAGHVLKQQMSWNFTAFYMHFWAFCDFQLGTLKGSARSLSSYSLSSTFSHSSALFSSLGRFGNHLSSIVFPLSGGRKTILWNWKLLVVVLMSSLCIDHFLQILSKAYFDWIWADENRIVNCVQSYWERRKLWTLMWTLMCMVISLTLYTPEKVACQILT